MKSEIRPIIKRKQYYEENADLEALDWIKSLSIEKIQKIHSKISPFSNKSDLEEYSKLISNYAYRYTTKKGYKKVSYNQNNNIGRQYSDKISFQNLQKDWRGLICQKNYQDLDMINSLPNILFYLVKNRCSCIYLTQYNETREDTLYLLKCDKKDFLIKYIMTDIVDIESEKTDYGKNLLKEIGMIKDILFDEFKNEYKPNKKNPKSSILAQLCFEKENEILEKVIKKINRKNIGALCFDGLMINNDYKINIEAINNLTKEYNVKWAIKPFSTILKIPNDYKSQIYTPLEIKSNFEKNHFIVRKPLVYVCIESDGTLNITADRSKFESLTAPYFNPDIYTLGSWMADSNRREYNKFDFIPYCLDDRILGTKLDCFNKSKNEKIYNMANAYESDYFYDKKAINYHSDALDWFIEFIKINICPQREGSENDWKWLLHFIIYKLKNPQLLHGVALIIKGDMGTGKDTLLQIIDNLMGNDYMYNQQETKHILGEVNTSLKNKLHVVLNEMSGAVGFSYCEQMKDLITRPTNNIKELYKDPYEMPNLSTLWILSNNMNPIQIPKDNRRYCLFVTSSINKGNQKYWNEIYKCMENIDFMNSLFTQLLDYKVPKDFNPRNTEQQPRSNKYFEMQNNQIDPIFKFLYNMDYSDLLGPISCDKSKWNGYYYSNKTDFKKLFNLWSGDETKIKTQKITTKIIEIEKGIFSDKSLCINGHKYNNMILFNKEEIITYLKKEYFKNIESEEIIIEDEIIENNGLDLNIQKD